MPREARLDRASSVTKLAATAAGSSHRRHGAVLAWPRWPGWDMRIALLLLSPGSGPDGSDGSGCGHVQAWRPREGHAARAGHGQRERPYSGMRGTTSRGREAVLAARER